MAGFVQEELDKLALEVAGKVLADLEPRLAVFAEEIVGKVVAAIENKIA